MGGVEDNFSVQLRTKQKFCSRTYAFTWTKLNNSPKVMVYTDYWPLNACWMPLFTSYHKIINSSHPNVITLRWVEKYNFKIHQKQFHTIQKIIKNLDNLIGWAHLWIAQLPPFWTKKNKANNFKKKVSGEFFCLVIQKSTKQAGAELC